ncbi:hypothetical protein ACNUDN_00960 [Mycobacterium sp. smrl_JER01]|uniref:hypothetical protein n=1 Tax=Mycobacterium sp. smrl_JER01 TaxID=3402633 RepID=UPI003AC0DF43
MSTSRLAAVLISRLAAVLISRLAAVLISRLAAVTSPPSTSTPSRTGTAAVGPVSPHWARST